MATEDKALWNRIKPWALLDIPQYVSNSGLVGSTVATDPNAAPKDAPYLTLATNATLTNERVLTVAGTTGLSGTDGGAGSTYTLSIASTLAGGGLALTSGVLDIGAGNGVTVAADSVAVNQAYAFAWSANHTHANSTTVGTTSFASGFAGSGWRVDQGISVASQTSAEFDNLTVRGQMRVYELVIHKIRVSLGSLAVSPGGGKVDTVTGSGPYTINFLDAHGLVANDLLRAQKFTGTGTYTSSLTVTSVTDSDTVVATLNSGNAPLAGYEYASIGNTSNTTRQGMLYLTADDSNAPFMDILDGVASHGDWGGYSKTKVRLGKLTGITDSFYGTLSGYGLYTNNAYLRNAYINGSLVIGPGVGFSVSPTFYAPLDVQPGNNTVNTNGQKGQRATITGGVSGVNTHLGGGAAVGFGTTNRIINPSIEVNTTGYFSDGGTVSRSALYSMFGQYSLRWISTGGNNNCYYFNTGTLAAGNMAFSVYARRTDGQAVTGVTCYVDSTQGGVTPSIVDVGNGWYRIIAYRYFASAPGNDVVGVYGLATGVEWYFDGWQVDNASDATPYCDGSLGSGFSWSGTAHASTSTRTAALLQYPITSMQPQYGTISMWAQIDSFNVDFAAGMLWRAGDVNGELDAHITNAGVLLFRINSVDVTHATAVTRGRHHIACVWDIAANTAVVYLDGVASSPGAPTTTLPTLATMIDVGCSAVIGTSYNLNGAVYDFAYIPRALTANDIAAIYNSGQRLNITRSNYELLLTEPGSINKVVANSGGIYGTSASYKPNFTLLNSNQTVNSESLGEGDAMLGDNTAGKANLLWDNSAGDLLVRRGTTTRIKAGSDGVLSINDSGGAAVFSFDASAGAEFTKALSLGTNGGIWQGSSGTFASPTTGFKLYKSGSDGNLDIWNGGDISVRIAPAEGVIIRAGSAFATDKALNFFTAGGTRTGEVYGYQTGTSNTVAMRSTGNDSARTSFAYISALQQSSSGKAYVYNWAGKWDGSSTLSAPWAIIKQETDMSANSARIFFDASSSSDTATLELKAIGATLTWAATGVSKSWRIDHPLYPFNKWLDHFTVEGPAHSTFYTGRATLDKNGEATIAMPEYFNALNRNVEIVFSPKNGSYGNLQLMDGGDIINNAFKFTGGKPGQLVAWIVTGERADAWAVAHPTIVEHDKEPDEVGLLAASREYGYDEAHSLRAARHKKQVQDYAQHEKITNDNQH